MLSWSWRVDLPNDAANLRHRDADDVAAEVCIGFAPSPDVVPFIDRQLLRVAPSPSARSTTRRGS